MKACRIISPSMEHKRDNVMYMLWTLVEQCQVVGKGLLSSGQMFECLPLIFKIFFYFCSFYKWKFGHFHVHFLGCLLILLQ